ncbi:MAG: hypothetical protein ACIAXF_13880 [Phycisphaerales bacterium JB063]
MAGTIHKFILDATTAQVVHSDHYITPISVGLQHGDVVMWCLVDMDRGPSRVRVEVRGTGHPIHGDIGKFLGTVLMDNGNLVWHVFVSPTENE